MRSEPGSRRSMLDPDATVQNLRGGGCSLDARCMRLTQRCGPEEKESSMFYRRFAVIAAGAAIMLGACSGNASPAASGGGGGGGGASGAGCTVGVSWNNFQQPRWAAHDKPNIQKTVEAQGGKYIDADANLSNEQQATDIDTMISKGAKVLILLAQDPKLVLPSVKKAKAAGIPVIG